MRNKLGTYGFFVGDGVFGKHAGEVGAEAFSQVIGLDRAAEPAR